MTGLLLTNLEPLVAERLEQEGGITLVPQPSEDFTPISNYLFDLLPASPIKSKTEMFFKVSNEETWKEDLSVALNTLFKEDKNLKFQAMVFLDDLNYFIVTRAKNKTLFRKAQAKLVPCYQSPTLLEEVIL